MHFSSPLHQLWNGKNTFQVLGNFDSFQMRVEEQSKGPWKSFPVRTSHQCGGPGTESRSPTMLKSVSPSISFPPLLSSHYYCSGGVDDAKINIRRVYREGVVHRSISVALVVSQNPFDNQPLHWFPLGKNVLATVVASRKTCNSGFCSVILKPAMNRTDARGLDNRL